MTCSICFEEPCQTVLLCGHTFHLNCILEWCAQSETCPICKKVIDVRHILETSTENCGPSVLMLMDLYKKTYHEQNNMYIEMYDRLYAHCLQRNQVMLDPFKVMDQPKFQFVGPFVPFSNVQSFLTLYDGFKQDVAKWKKQVDDIHNRSIQYIMQAQMHQSDAHNMLVEFLANQMGAVSIVLLQ